MKSQNRKSKKVKILLTVLAAIVIVGMLLQVTPIREAVAKATGWAGDTILKWARVAVSVGIGGMLVIVGAMVISAPVLGGSLIVIGLAVLAYTLWPLFKDMGKTNVGPASLQKVA